MCKGIVLTITAVFVFAIASSEFSWAQTNARGSYSTQVPIEVPPFYGITPVVKLVYQSSGGAGLAGAGWDLLAGSVISRRSATNGTPLFAPNDMFVLDGEELVPCKSGSTSPSCTTAVTAFGTSAGFYSTRVESFERIRFDANAGMWTIWSRDGIQRTYVSGDGGLSYQMRIVGDTYNNLVNYSWTCAASGNGPCRLDDIIYGANLSTGGSGVAIRFYYEGRPDPRGIATGRGRAWLGERLRSIVVNSHGQLLRAYRLQYQPSLVSGASILTSIQQYGRDASVDATGKITAGATDPLPPITFKTDSMTSGAAWQFATETALPEALNVGTPRALTPVYARPSTSLTVEVDTWVPTGGSPANDQWRPNGTVVGDFDGDGRAEVLAWGLDIGCANLSLAGHLTTPTGLGPAVNHKIATGLRLFGKACHAQVFSADINGDGNDDIVAAIEGNLRVAKGRSDGTFVASTSGAWNPDNRGCVVADVDGDRRADIVCEDPKARMIRTYRSGSRRWTVATVSTDSIYAPKPNLPSHMELRIAAGDVDGDGLANVVLALPVGTTTRIIIGRSLGDGTYDWSEEQTIANVFLSGRYDNFHLTDLDGDGRLDLGFTQAQSSSGPTTINYALARKGYGSLSGRWRVQPTLVSLLYDVSFADIDGDGRADLLGGGGTGQISYQLASPLGGFLNIESTNTDCRGRLTAADLNGDGLADALCIDGNEGNFTLVDRPSQSRGTDRHRWSRADLNGDGRLELVYIAFQNLGYQIHVVSPQNQGQTSFMLGPSPQTGPLVEPDASRWIFADVGSPAGPADGKDDLVLVEQFGGALQVTTLLSTGLGAFTVYHQTVWQNYPDRSTLGWFSAHFDLDGRAELARIRPITFDSVAVDVLRPTGAGQWATTSQPNIRVSSRHFLVADVNRDRLTDLVHVESPAGANATVLTLRADGQGGFTEARTTIPAASLDSPQNWKLGDLDGDGVPDLVSVNRCWNTILPCLAVSHFPGNGLGGFSTGGSRIPHAMPSGNDTSNPLYTRLFEDSSNVVLIDLDGDGSDEIVHTTHAVDTNNQLRLILTRIKRDLTSQFGEWFVTPEVIQLANDHGDAWAWVGHRDPVTGAAGLAYVHSKESMTISWRGPTDELTSIKNGIGLTTTIKYGPYLNSRAYLPSGYVPRIVTQVATLDEAYNPPVRDTIEYSYYDARWSDHDGALAGFGVREARDSRARYITRFVIDDMCGNRVTQTSTNTLTSTRRPRGSEMWGSANIHYVAPGTNAPFRCMPDVTERFECEPNQPCRMAEKVEQDYDPYGNVIMERTFADKASPTRTSTPVQVNPNAYIINRAILRATEGMIGNTSKLMAQRLFYYDEQAKHDMPPGAHGALTKVGDWDDLSRTYKETSYKYYANSILKEVVTPGGKTSTTKLDSTYGRFPEYLCDAINNCVEQKWDLSLGKVTRLTDAAGGVRVTQYDEFGRVKQVDHPGGGFTRTKYLDNSVLTGPISGRQRVRTEISDASIGDGVLWNETFFDGSGRTYRTTREGGATVTTTYSDASARPAAVSLVHDVAAPPTQWTRFAYDDVGRAVSLTHPDGASVGTTYTLGQVESRDEMGVPTVRRFDGAGRVTELVEPTVGPTQAVTNYSYDALGRMETITNALGNQDTFAWNTLGRRTASTDPDRGKRDFYYYDDGELREQVDAKGQHIAWTYDTIGRAIRREDRDATGKVTRTIKWIYDDGANPQGSSRGRLVRVDDSQPDTSTTFSREYWYDAGGRVTSERTCIDGTCMNQGTEYDQAGRVSAHIYPNTFGNTQAAGAERLTYSYDVAGRIDLVGRYADLDWKLDDSLDKINYGNGVKTKFDYDTNRRWLDSIGIQNPSGGQLQHIEYLHYRDGRIKNQTATGIQSVTLDYTYDNLGRLRKVQSSDPTRSEKFDYDTIGRLTWSPALGDVKYGDPLHIHAATKTDFDSKRSYDPNGNTEKVEDPNGRNLILEWTVDDHIVQIKDVRSGQATTFGYDPDGQRIKKTGPTGTLRLFGPLLALDEQGRMVKYYMAGDLLLARIDSAISYFHNDVSRATRLITDQNGLRIADYQYTAFGAPVGGGTMPDNEIGFSGARRDTELGLVAMGARTYDPALGQFLSADSYIPDTYRPQSLNRYSYVENDPINHWDPSGHMKMQVEYRKLRSQESPHWSNEYEYKGCGNPLVECQRGKPDLQWDYASDHLILVASNDRAWVPGSLQSADQVAVLMIFGDGVLRNAKVYGGTLKEARIVVDSLVQISKSPNGKALGGALPNTQWSVQIGGDVNVAEANPPLGVVKIGKPFIKGPVCCYVTAVGESPFTLTRVLAHEIGHLTGIDDSGINRMDNVNTWENPIMQEVTPLEPDRSRYYVPHLPYPVGSGP